MKDDSPTTAVDGFARRLWSEAVRLVLMAEFECRDGTQVSFSEAKGVSTETFRSWRRRHCPAAAAAAGKPAARVTAGEPGGFVGVAAVPGGDVELSLGDRAQAMDGGMQPPGRRVRRIGLVHGGGFVDVRQQETRSTHSADMALARPDARTALPGNVSKFALTMAGGFRLKAKLRLMVSIPAHSAARAETSVLTATRHDRGWMDQ